MSIKPWIIYGLLFLSGTASGLVSYLQNDHQPATNQPSNNAIGLHIVIAVVLLLAIVSGCIMNKKRTPTGQNFAAFWKAPFTESGWRQLLYAVTALPLNLLQCWLAAFGQSGLSKNIEHWQMKFILRLPGSLKERQGYFPNLAHSFLELLLGIILAIAGYLIVFGFWRAGLQVFGALDPAFTANAWGGPSYFGASLAHWMDGFIMFYFSTLVIRIVGKLKEQWTLKSE